MSISDIIEEIRDFFGRAEDRVESTVMRILDRAKDEVRLEAHRVKRWIFASIFQAAFYILGIVLLLGALTLFAGRWLPFDLVLLIEGVLLIYAALMLHLVRP
ncbi:MAG TPA: hypothetical protein VFF28_02675 [Candidatus Nanoarchaeia archaeon]|nr:hypothetical protein [Candidatus Nanoarchaeia archaeon]